jgi:hypothetical protein
MVMTTNAPTVLGQYPEAGIWESARIRVESGVVVPGVWLVTGAKGVTVFVEVRGIPTEEGFTEVELQAIRDHNRTSAVKAWRTFRSDRFIASSVIAGEDHTCIKGTLQVAGCTSWR